jgi:hypothetical protein
VGAVIRQNKRIVHGFRDNCSYSTGIQEHELFLDHIRAKICIFKTKAKPAICLTLGEFRLLRNPDIARNMTKNSERQKDMPGNMN